jgi:hypothetical protein
MAKIDNLYSENFGIKENLQIQRHDGIAEETAAA